MVQSYKNGTNKNPTMERVTRIIRKIHTAWKIFFRKRTRILNSDFLIPGRILYTSYTIRYTNINVQKNFANFRFSGPFGSRGLECLSNGGHHLQKIYAGTANSDPQSAGRGAGGQASGFNGFS